MTKHQLWQRAHDAQVRLFIDANPQTYIGRGLTADEFNEEHAKWHELKDQALEAWRRANPAPKRTRQEQDERDRAQAVLDQFSGLIGSIVGGRD